MKKQEYTIGDLGDVKVQAELLTKLNKIISDDKAYCTQVAKAYRYYENENAIMAIDEGQVEQKVAAVETSPLRRADNRVPFNYHQILVDQKAAYLFGQMVLLKSMSEDQAADTFDEKLKELSKRLHRYLGMLAIKASNAGHGWLYPYVNEQGEFKMASMDPLEIIPIYDATIERNLVYVIRHYGVGKDQMIEFHTPENITVWKNNKLEEERSQFKLGEVGGAWDSIPFIEFNNTPEKMDDLHKYKALIDVFDKTVSLYANDIEDMQQLIFVLVNYGAQDLNQFTSDLKKYKVVNMDKDGSLDTLKVDIPVEARIKLLELLDTSIWMSGQGVDPRLKELGNLSGTALKQLYGLLELKASQMESEFREAIQKLIDLYKQYLLLTDKTDFSEIEVDQIYTRSMISNTMETITMAQNSKGVISDETIIGNHPWVEDVQLEMDRMKKETEENITNQQKAFGLDADMKMNPLDPNAPDPNKTDPNAKQDPTKKKDPKAKVNG